MDLARAAVEHSLAIGQAYRENMALRHGLERPDHIRLADTPPRDRQAAPAATKSVVPVAQAIPLPERLGWSPWAVGAAAGLGGLVSAASGWLLATGTRSEPPPRPAAQAEIVIERPADRDDLLGYLQERGAHLPPQRRTP